MINLRIQICCFVICLIYTGGNCCAPTPDLDPLESQYGGQVLIRCEIFGSTCISDITAMRWEKKTIDGDWGEVYTLYKDQSEEFTNNGYTLEGRTDPRVFGGQYDLRITNSTVADSGEWKCVYVNADSTTESIIASIEVTGQCDIDIDKSGGDEYVINTEYTYTCICRKAYPSIDHAKWITGNTEAQTKEIDPIPTGYVYELRSEISWKAEDTSRIPVTCIIEKNSGTVPWISQTTFIPTTVATPAIMEARSNNTNTATLDTTLTLQCTFSGTDVTVRWKRNGNVMEFPNDLFLLSEKPVTGNFSFGQTDALESTITWIPPPSSQHALCNDKTKHSGEYTCEGVGLGPSEDFGDMLVVFEHTNGCVSTAGLICSIVFPSIAVLIAVGVGIYLCTNGK